MRNETMMLPTIDEPTPTNNNKNNSNSNNNNWQSNSSRSSSSPRVGGGKGFFVSRPALFSSSSSQEHHSMSMSSSSSSSRGHRLLSLLLAFVTGMAVMQTMIYSSSSSPHAPTRPRGGGRGYRTATTITNDHYYQDAASDASSSSSVAASSPTTTTTTANQKYYQYQSEMVPLLRNPSSHEYGQCRFYMAKSVVAPNAGLGMFVGEGGGLLPGDTVGFPDICIFVTHPPPRWTHLHSHSWGSGMYFGQLGEDRDTTRIACEGYGTIYNTMPQTHYNVRIQSAIQPTHAGATRQTPGAGSISHQYGVHGVALDPIPPGSELTINYYDWDFGNRDYTGIRRPQTDVQALQREGWCVDHMEIRPSSAGVPGIGRGAFVKRPLPKGTVVVPAPLQAFEDRAEFQLSKPEQLFVNYCLQPANSKMLFYPYGPGVNLVNHPPPGTQPNVAWQWSTNPLHDASLLQLNSTEQFWKHAKPGSLILELVAVRDLQAGEELFVDYGSTWVQAWERHVATWQPPAAAPSHVYPQDMDPTDVLRTVEEQTTDPYPDNLITICNSQTYGRSKQKRNLHLEWSETKPEDAFDPKEREEWWWNMAYCHVLDRKMGDDGAFEYTVALIDRQDMYTAQDLTFDPTVPFQERMVDTHVPRDAIRWIEKPYQDDDHLMNAFRQPMEFPSHLVPKAWLTEGNQR